MGNRHWDRVSLSAATALEPNVVSFSAASVARVSGSACEKMGTSAAGIGGGSRQQYEAVSACEKMGSIAAGIGEGMWQQHVSVTACEKKDSSATGFGGGSQQQFVVEGAASACDGSGSVWERTIYEAGALLFEMQLGGEVLH